MTLDFSFKDLADVAAQGNAGAGRPRLIAIDSIDEDPDQPRRNFSEQELDGLAQSIREHGVLQPVLLRRSAEEGRHVIILGARRYRAAHRAGLYEIPAIIHDGRDPDRYAQMIENIQRDDLRAPEIVAFIADRLDAGDTQADISRKLGKPRDWVSRYAAVQSMPEFLRARLENCSIRALYELYQAWRTHPDAIERLCATRDGFTDAQARQLAGTSAPSPIARTLSPYRLLDRPNRNGATWCREHLRGVHQPQTQKQQAMIRRQSLASSHHPGRQHP